MSGCLSGGTPMANIEAMVNTTPPYGWYSKEG
jgi:hypothetical protein